jgi:hypothetical protein
LNLTHTRHGTALEACLAWPTVIPQVSPAIASCELHVFRARMRSDLITLPGSGRPNLRRPLAEIRRRLTDPRSAQSTALHPGSGASGDFGLKQTRWRADGRQAAKHKCLISSRFPSLTRVTEVRLRPNMDSCPQMQQNPLGAARRNRPLLRCVIKSEL